MIPVLGDSREPTEGTHKPTVFELTGLRHMYRFNKTDNAIATDHFARAIALDPGFARAFAARSFTSFQSAFVNYGSDRTVEIENALRQGVRGEATGLDLIAAELCRAAPTEVACIISPLSLKFTSTLPEALPWKCGHAGKVYKQRGKHIETKSHRAVLRAGISGKKMHTVVRKKVLGAVATGISVSQYSGVPGRSADTASH